MGAPIRCSFPHLFVEVVLGMVLLMKSITLFILAGLLEIGGGYLVWQWWRGGAALAVGAAGAVFLVIYGIVPTYQPAHFGRVYAAYGGWFVVLSLAWGWAVDRIAPDRYDIAGGLLCLIGVGIIMYWPR
jgi:small multidrug resistance family-3 protein